MPVVVCLLSLCPPFGQWDNTTFFTRVGFFGENQNKISYHVVVFMPLVCPNLYNACVAIRAVIAALWGLGSLVQAITL